MTLPRLPIVGTPMPGTLEAYLIELVEALDRELSDLRRVAGKERYNPTNVTTTRSFDASAATLAQTRDTLGTLLLDMKGRGFIG